MYPHEALRQIAEIRERMARSQSFQGFASLAVAISGVLAFLGPASQRVLVPSPMEHLTDFLLLWISVAALSLAAAIVGLWSRTKRTGSALGREKAAHAIEQLAPCFLVGALLTFFLHRDAPEAGWMLPGVWALVFSLAVFASRRMLSPEVLWVGGYYVVAGIVCLSFGRGAGALAPWQMALSFGGGQLFGAAVLYWTVERDHAEP